MQAPSRKWENYLRKQLLHYILFLVVYCCIVMFIWSITPTENVHIPFRKDILSASARLVHFTVSFVRVTVWCNFVVCANRYDTIALMWLNGAADNAQALLEPHHRKSKLHVTHLNAYPQHLGRRCVYLVPLCGQLNEKNKNQGTKIGDTGEITIVLQLFVSLFYRPVHSYWVLVLVSSWSLLLLLLLLLFLLWRFLIKLQNKSLKWALLARILCEVQQVFHSSMLSGGVGKTRSLPKDQISMRRWVAISPLLFCVVCVWCICTWISWLVKKAKQQKIRTTCMATQPHIQ